MRKWNYLCGICQQATYQKIVFEPYELRWPNLAHFVSSSSFVGYVRVRISMKMFRRGLIMSSDRYDEKPQIEEFQEFFTYFGVYWGSDYHY